MIISYSDLYCNSTVLSGVPSIRVISSICRLFRTYLSGTLLRLGFDYLTVLIAFVEDLLDLAPFTVRTNYST